MQWIENQTAFIGVITNGHGLIVDCGDATRIPEVTCRRCWAAACAEHKRRRAGSRHKRRKLRFQRKLVRTSGHFSQKAWEKCLCLRTPTASSMTLGVDQRP